MQWIEDPTQSNVGILSNVRRDVSTNFRKIKTENLISKFEELESKSKFQTIRVMYRGINEFRMGYLPRCNIVKYEKGDFCRIPRYED